MGVYLLAAAAFLGLRHGVLPRIDDWRPQLEAAAGRALDADVRIARIQANWRGLHPRFTLEDVLIGGGTGEALRLPRVQAVLSWRSLLAFGPRFDTLAIEDVEVSLRRDTGNRLWVAGRAFEMDDGEGRFSLDKLNRPVTRWLAEQGDLVVRNATVRWHDESRAAPPLALQRVNLRMRNGLFHHALALEASPPAALARGITVRAEADHGFFRAPLSHGGEVYVELDDAEPAAWQPWLDLPDGAGGRVALRAWGQVGDGALQHVLADVAARDASLGQARPAWHAGAAALTATIQGAPGDILPDARRYPWLARTSRQDGMAVSLAIDGIEIDAPTVFPAALPPVQAVYGSLRVSRSARQAWRVTVGDTRIRNADLDARLQGTWHSEGRTRAGTADFEGTLRRASMNAIHRYLPSRVTENARRWLAQGLPRGQVTGASVVVRGDLADFPFENPGETGDFVVAGRVSGADVDYAPARDGRPAWPMLQGLSGTFRIERDGLFLNTVGGIVRTSPGHSVALGGVAASIPHMARGARVLVDGSTEGPAQSYLAMMPRSPLGQILKGALDEAQASGNWTVPLKLDIPLKAVRDAQVAGSVTFDGGDFLLTPSTPPFRAIRGTLDFSHRGVGSAGLQGEFLGGGYRIAGELTPGAPGLAFEGRLTGEGLREAMDTPLAGRMAGSTAYRGNLAMRPDKGVDFVAESDLKGMALDFPAPLGKPADTAMPLNIDWESGGGRQGGQRLAVALGQDIDLVMQRDDGASDKPFFQRGVVAVGKAARLPQAGLVVSASLPAFDLDAWTPVSEGVGPDTPVRKGAPRTAGSLLPPVSRIDLDAGRLTVRGLDWDDVSLQVQVPKAGGAWHAKMASRQATGSANWTPATNGGAAKVDARLQHLALGQPRDGESQAAKDGEPVARHDPEPRFDDDAFDNLPDLDVQVDQLVLFGHEAGALQLQGGNRERGSRWGLETLRLSNPDGTLTASGTWRLSGADRGLSLDTHLNAQSLGSLLERMGQKDLLAGGKGDITASLTWRDFPWRHDYTELGGQLQAQLSEGRFVSVRSRTARLLELLALQSAQRLAKLEFDPGAALTRGFTFDTLRASIDVSSGTARIPAMKVDGPAATIALAGSTDLVRESWDMEAVVVPNLDASGAALAAGIAINPVLGLGAFVTQWLLREPLARAMTAQYKVSGSWDAPEISTVETVVRRQEEDPVEH